MTPKNPIVRFATIRPGRCITCEASIPLGVYYLERTGGRVCRDCTRSLFGLDLPLPPTPEETVLARVTKRPASEALAHLGDGCCWIWNGPLDRGGYARAAHGWAHRWSYERLVGPIPTGLHLDHLCKQRSCVAPHHLEPVTSAENNRRSYSTFAAAMRLRAERRTHCKNGHEFTPENTVIRENGARRCVECRRRAHRAFEQRKKAGAA